MIQLNTSNTRMNFLQKISHQNQNPDAMLYDNDPIEYQQHRDEIISNAKTPINLNFICRRWKRQQKRTITLFKRSSVEDSRKNRAIFDVNLNRKANDAHGGEQQSFAKWCCCRCFFCGFSHSPHFLLEFDFFGKIGDLSLFFSLLWWVGRRRTGRRLVLQQRSGVLYFFWVALKGLENVETWKETPG